MLSRFRSIRPAFVCADSDEMAASSATEMETILFILTKIMNIVQLSLANYSPNPQSQAKRKVFSVSSHWFSVSDEYFRLDRLFCGNSFGVVY